MKKVLFGLAVAAALVMSVGSASAEQAGFYVGGELGWSFSHASTFSDDHPTTNVSTFGNSQISTDAGNSPLVGIKVGYRFNDMFRADVGADYRWAYNISGSNPGGPTSYKSDLTNWTVMTNGYVEPVNIGGFKPYVGAGIGVAINSATNTRYTFTKVDTQDDRTSTNFAWQLMAGVAYPLNDKVTLDLGYRYLDAGKIALGGSASQQDAATKGHLVASEMVFSVRYGF